MRAYLVYSTNRRARARRALCLLLAGIGLALSACGMPLTGDESASSTATTESNEPTEPLPTLSIVTPTPFDPADVPPTEPDQDQPIEVPDAYIVQEGDSLYSIAARFRVEIADLVALNGLSDPNDIQVGQELQIPQPE